ncbi:MAG TPA: helix-turn-helix transcriptional regulator [Polyangiaceae bacterium]|nr:helix-turn-helix transcriptional regulator [Polyangiaceae bacterium]
MSPSAPLFQPFPMLEGRSAQAWRHQPAFRRPRHFHEEPECNLALRGRAVVSVGAKTFTLSPGSLGVFWPGQDHELLEASADLELVVMALRPELASKIDGWQHSRSSNSIELDARRVARIGERASAVNAMSDRLAVESTLASVFDEIASAFGRSHSLSRRAALALQQSSACSGDELSRRLRAHRSNVSRTFKDDWGVTLVDFRARVRLMKFIQLVDSGQSLTEAALAADFGSYAQCHRVFQRFLRCAPRTYFAGARSTIDSALAEPAGR